MSRTPIDLFVEAFAAAAGPVLSGKASKPWTVTVDQESKPLPAGTQVVTILMVAEPSQAEAAIQVSVETAVLVTSIPAGSTTTAEGVQPGHAQAVRIVLEEACEKAAKVLQGIQIRLRVAKDINWTPVSQFSLMGINGDSGSIQLQLLFPANWPQGANDAAVAPSKSPQSQAAPGIDVSLLENVQIEVTLQFGERRLPLREIGELRSGSVVELDKYIQDPAELLLGDRVIARGEVVVVDGNYGLRVTEVV
jgi:flagellar motor switch protein FliN